MTTQIRGIDDAEKYAEEVDLSFMMRPMPMNESYEELIRKLLRNAYQSGMTKALGFAVDMVKGHQK